MLTELENKLIEEVCALKYVLSHGKWLMFSGEVSLQYGVSRMKEMIDDLEGKGYKI